jgi:predicted extracellular nuclease
MMKWLIFLSVLFPLQPLNAQKRGDIRAMFYNTENLFDTRDDKFINDNEYTPTGRLNWSRQRYDAKLTAIFKVITAIGELQPPEIVGLCEVENKQVLVDLITETPLNKYPYQIVHHDSPDPRGIDVAFLYRTDKLKLLSNKPIIINFPRPYENHKTRNILMAKFLIDADTLHVFVNHWPSRRAGEMESEFFRVFVARKLKEQVDSLLQVNKKAKILIMGDLNDEPIDKSLKEGLEALPVSQTINNSKLYNLSYYYANSKQIGTHKFKAKWEIFDQIIVSGNLLNATEGLHCQKQSGTIFSADFILQTDERNLGYRPFQTYAGMKYLGGFSDHLPVFVDFQLTR